MGTTFLRGRAKKRHKAWAVPRRSHSRSEDVQVPVEDPPHSRHASALYAVRSRQETGSGSPYRPEGTGRILALEIANGSLRILSTLWILLTQEDATCRCLLLWARPPRKGSDT